MRRLHATGGQATVLVLGLAFAAIAAAVVLVALANAVGARGHAGRVADLAAVSAARAMRAAYPRLFEPARLPSGAVNRRHLSRAEYLRRARAAALHAARRGGAPLHARDVGFPDGGSFAPVRVRVAVRAQVAVRPGPSSAPRAVPIRASAEAEVAPAALAGWGTGAAGPAVASGGGYKGPLAYRMGKPMRPDVAAAFDRLHAAARAAGVALVVTSGFRSDAEQARLFAANPNPRWVARPGTSLHRYGSELDLGPPAAYGWLARNAPRFGFVKRYAWEPWHFGFGTNPRAPPRALASAAPVDARHAEGRAALPSFVPARFERPIARASARWNVPAALLAAQLYAESNFNPFARSPAGAQGIAQFMPATARAYGLRDPFHAESAIDAQARMMSDLLRRFGSAALALAAYNAGPARVGACRCVPPFPETRGYVARILGLLGGAGELSLGGGGLEVRLVR